MIFFIWYRFSLDDLQMVQIISKTSINHVSPIKDITGVRRCYEKISRNKTRQKDTGTRNRLRPYNDIGSKNTIWWQQCNNLTDTNLTEE